MSVLGKRVHESRDQLVEGCVATDHDAGVGSRRNAGFIEQRRCLVQQHDRLAVTTLIAKKFERPSTESVTRREKLVNRDDSSLECGALWRSFE